jgi:beta-glucanase (GH16 family)
MKTKASSPYFLAVLAPLIGVLTQAAPDWQLVWSDEFNGSSIDRSNWTYDTGGGGWGNSELEYYTDRSTNSYIYHDPASGNGFLVLQALHESYRNRSYTSARLKTQGLRNWTYGRIEASIKVPNGQGVWPAFWMLGSNFSTVGWPGCGELDIMEHVTPIGANTIRGSAHAPGFSGANSMNCDDTLANLSSQFHTYAIEWGPSEIRYYVDTTQYFSVTPQTATCGQNKTPLPGTWIFDHPFFVILNLAIGGDWPGSPNAATQFPVQMWVDYVRVYRDATLRTPTASLKVGKLAMSTSSSGSTWQAAAKVTVLDEKGAPASGVNVSGTWSGVINVGVVQQTTDASGVATLTSGKARQSGTITFCVNNLAKPGFTYIPGQDCASISR